MPAYLLGMMICVPLGTTYLSSRAKTGLRTLRATREMLYMRVVSVWRDCKKGIALSLEKSCLFVEGSRLAFSSLLTR